MWKCSLTEYSQTPDFNFFLCRRCRNHIALTQEFFFRDQLDLGYFRNIINVNVRRSAYYHREEDHTGADVFCYTCDNPLGWKLIEMASDSRTVLVPGTFILFLHELLLWDGGQMLDAETYEPVEDV